MSADLAEVMTEAEARRLTERIRTALDRVATSWADLADRVTEAYERRADLALGYDSWQSYAAAELRPSEGIAAEVRRELVGLLSARRMSVRAIAPTVGLGKSQVSDIRSQVSGNRTPEHQDRTDWTPEDHAEQDDLDAFDGIDFTTGEVLTDQRGGIEPPSSSHDVEEQESGEGSPPAPRPASVVGLDGKTYTRPAPVERGPIRRPLREGFRDAALDLDKLVGRFERLVGDDRYPRNRNEVAPYRNDLIRARDALDRLIEQMSN